jgi:UDP-glucose 4-epimerase
LTPGYLGDLGALAVKRMRILVTGGAGFIGSHVADAYVQAGHEVWVLDDLSRGRRDQINSHARFVCMDLRSPDLYDLLAEGHFDCINHHAAQIDVRSSVADPARDAMINIVGTLNVLEAARALGIPRIVFASTGGAIYGEQHHLPATEQHPTVPVSPYGVAKLTVEHYLEYYRQVHGLRYVVLRYANVYGPRQDPEGEAGVVAIFCKKILRKECLTIYGDGDQTRDYVYVDDVARANVLALRYLTRPVVSASLPGSLQLAAGSELGTAERPNGRTAERIFNIGTGIETSVNALAAMLLEAADTDCNVEYAPVRPGEQMRSSIDPSRAAQILGWTPLTPLFEGLTQTLAWFRSKEPAGSRQLAVGSRQAPQ